MKNEKTKPVKPKKKPSFDVGAPDLNITIESTEREIQEYYARYNEFEPTDLSHVQTVFALEYIKNGFKIAAAVRKAVGEDRLKRWTNRRTPTQVGTNWLIQKKVIDFIQDQLNARCERLQVTAEWIARKYKIWSEIDVTQFIELKENAEGGHTLSLKQNLEDLPKSIRTSIKSVSVGVGGDVKVDFVDGKSALDSLSKLLGMFNDKLEIDTKENLKINLVFDKQDSDA